MDRPDDIHRIQVRLGKTLDQDLRLTPSRPTVKTNMEVVRSQLENPGMVIRAELPPIDLLSGSKTGITIYSETVQAQTLGTKSEGLQIRLSSEQVQAQIQMTHDWNLKVALRKRHISSNMKMDRFLTRESPGKPDFPDFPCLHQTLVPSVETDSDDDSSYSRGIVLY